MSTVIETYTIAAQGITVSQLVWRRFRREMPGLVERIYDLNRGLGDLPLELPVGTVVLLPVDTSRDAAPIRQEPVQIWS